MFAVAEFRGIAIALAIGLLLGFEREHHEWRDHRSHQPAGARTFSVLAVAGAISAAIDPAVVGACVVGVAVLLAVSYWKSDGGGVGITTEASAVACVLLGALSWDHQALAVATASALALVLQSKDILRRLIREVVTDDEVTDAARWFVLAFVVLPLMPNRGFGPSGSLNPQRMWGLVLLLTGVGWLGYIATRAVGERRGLLVVGAAGGFVSGAATTLSLARLARNDPAVRRSALGGSILAGVATCVQMAVLSWVTYPTMGQRVAVPMGAGAVVLIATAWVVDRNGPRSVGSIDQVLPARRPLALTGSLIGAGLLGLTLTISRLLVERVDAHVALAVIAAGGLADAHSAGLSAVSLVRDGAVRTSTGLAFVAAALGANTVTKLVAAAGAGGRWFATRFALSMLPAAAAIGIAFWLVIRSGW